MKAAMWEGKGQEEGRRVPGMRVRQEMQEKVKVMTSHFYLAVWVSKLRTIAGSSRHSHNLHLYSTIKPGRNPPAHTSQAPAPSRTLSCQDATSRIEEAERPCSDIEVDYLKSLTRTS